jgi:hypothetical protein
MTDTISDQYNLAPSAGNDPEDTDFVVAASDGGATPIGDHFFRAQVNPDSLVVNVSPVSGVDYDYWIDVVNSDVEPVYPTNFTEGQAPLRKTLGGWAAEEWRRYVYLDATSTMTQIQTEDGTGTILVVPNDTIDPTGSLVGTKSTTNPETEVDYVLTATDEHSGVDESRTQAFDSVSLLPITAEGVSSTVTLVFAPGTATSVFFRVWDLDNNFIDTSPVVVYLDDPVNLAAGILSIDDIANPVAAISQSEETTPLVVTVNLTGNSDGFAKTATLKLRKWTATNSGQVDTALPGGGVVTVTPPATQGTLSIVVVDTDYDTDDRLEVYIDSTAAPGGGDAPAIGTNNAIYADLIGSSGVAGIVYQMTDDWGNLGAGVWGLVLDADMPWTMLQDINYKSYRIDTDYTDIAAAGGAKDNTPLNVGIAPDDCYTLEAGGYNAVDSYLNGARARQYFNVPVAGDYVFWLRGANVGANYTTYIVIDGVAPGSNEWAHIDHAQDVWDFSPLADKNTDRNEPITTYLAARDHYVDIIARESGPGILFWNRLHITNATRAQYDPSGESGGSGPDLGALADEPLGTLPSGETTPDPDNPTTLPPIGFIPTATLTPTLYPLNGSDNQSQSLTLSFEFPVTVTGIQIYPYAFAVTSNGGTVSGKWETDGIRKAFFNKSDGTPVTFPLGATIVVTAAATEAGIIYDGVTKRGINLGTWSYTVLPVTGESQFANVPLIPGAMDFSWYATATGKFVTGADDPIDWPAAYSAALRVVPANDTTSLQLALASALPGDFIMLTGSWVSTTQVAASQPGTETNPIVICSEYKATGNGNPTVVSGGDKFLEFATTANWNIIGGFKLQFFSTKCIDLAPGTVAGTTYNDGATDVRITGMILTENGKLIGTLDGLIKIGDRSHRCRIDHNAIYGNYNALRYKYAQSAGSNVSASKNMRCDHNYFGPVGTAGSVDSSYEIAAVQTIGNTDAYPAWDDMTLTCDFNVVEMPYVHGYSDVEIFEIKSNGATIENNIGYGSEAQASIGFRRTSRSLAQTNYLIGMGVKIVGGDDNDVHDNYIDGNATLNRGLILWRTRRRKYPQCGNLLDWNDGVGSETECTNNTVLGCIDDAADIGSEDFGARYRLNSILMNNNNLSNAAGVGGGGSSGTSGEYVGTLANAPDSQYVGCASYVSGVDNLGGTNQSMTITTNSYTPASGNLYDADASPGGAAGSSLA